MSTATLDLRGVGDVERLLNDLHDAGGKKPGLMVRERAGALGRYLAESTQPAVDAERSEPRVDATTGKLVLSPTAVSGDTAKVDGKSKSARQLGINAAVGDVRRVYVMPSRVFAQVRELAAGAKAKGDKDGMHTARVFYKLMKEGRYEDARVILNSLGLSAANLEIIRWDGGARHKHARNARGRINRGMKPSIVGDERELKEYLKEIAKRVGWAKSGWITAAKQIPQARFGKIPAFFKLPAAGRGVDRTHGLNPQVILTNQVGYISRILDQRGIARAQIAFEESLRRELEIVIEKLREKHAGVLAG